MAGTKEDLPDSLKIPGVEDNDEELEIEIVDEDVEEKPKKKVEEEADEDDVEEDVEDEEEADEEADSDEEDDESDDEEEVEEDDEDDLKSYSKNVKARIKREINLRRRIEGELETVKSQATGYIKKVAEERDGLQVEHDKLRDSYVALLKSSLEEKATRLQKDYKQAKEAMDADAEAQAMSEMQTVAMQRSQLTDIERNLAADRATRKAKADAAPPPQQQHQSAAAPNAPTKKGEVWIAKRKTWFGNKSKEAYIDATAYAYEIDRRLVNEGYSPNEDDYFRELDRRVSKRFPELYKAKSKAATRSTSAPVGRGATRSTPKGASGNKVRLTRADLETMRAFHLDPKNPAHLKAFAAQKRAK